MAVAFVLDGLELKAPFKVDFGVTSLFNDPRDYPHTPGPDAHEGIDLDVFTSLWDSKEPVLCVYPGTVSKVRRSTGAYYNYVVVQHDYKGTTFYTWYAHLDDVYVAEGQQVTYGSKLGEIGDTGGNWAEHLHFNLQVPGHGLSGYVVPDVIDPKPYLSMIPQNIQSGTCYLGLHSSADGGRLYGGEAEKQEFRNLKPEVIKVLSNIDPDDLGDLAVGNTGVKIWIVRLFLDFGGRVITPDQFWNDTKNDLQRTVDVLAGAGVSKSDIYLEIHNEPNLSIEGWGTSWQDGRQFSSWLNDVIRVVRSVHPQSKILSPGLSPGFAIDNIRMDHNEFLSGMVYSFGNVDAIGVHSYWSDGFPYQTAIDHVNYYNNRFNKPLLITEASRNDHHGNHSSVTYANEYRQFWNDMKSISNVLAVTYFVASASNPTFWWEAWVRENGSRGIAYLIRNGIS